MAIIYKGIIEKLKKRGVNSYTILKTGDFGGATMTAFRNNEPVNLKTIDKVCQILECKIEDIVEIVLDSELKPEREKKMEKLRAEYIQKMEDLGYDPDGNPLA